MQVPLEGDGAASKAKAEMWGRIAFRAAVIVVPAALSWGFMQIGWFWNGLGWAGIGMIALIAVMAVYAIATMSRLNADANARRQIRLLQENLAALRQTAQIPCELAEAMWCETQRDRLLEKYRILDGAIWEQTLSAYKAVSSTSETERDRWTPAAEELALWARRNLPALYTGDDIERPTPQQAPGETEMAEPRRMEYRALYWRKQMMDRYVEGIAGKLEVRAEELRGQIADAGNPLTRS